MLPEPKISYKPFWGICRPLNSWRANSPNPIQIYCAELNAEITTTILSEMGFEVKAVEDGILCVNEMQHQPANTYDLILMDIQMPNMDGYKATHCIRRFFQPEKANIPIIAMSANAFEEDKKKAFDVKMNDYITKPIDFQKMEEVLKNILCKKDPLS